MKRTLFVAVWLLGVGLGAYGLAVDHAGAGSYDYGDPTESEQAVLEAVNRARMDPQAEAERRGIDLMEGVPVGKITGAPVQPLTMNARLLQAARAHARDMIGRRYRGHVSPDGQTPLDRLRRAGYAFRALGENYAMRGSTEPMTERDTALHLHADLFIDAGIAGRGHRVNILSARFKEVGIGLASGKIDSYPYSTLMVTDFAASLPDSRSFVLGVVYDDRNGDGQYGKGEGVGGVAIRVVETGADTVSASAGGYAIPLSPGGYALSVRLPDGREIRRRVNIADRNVKVDFRVQDF